MPEGSGEVTSYEQRLDWAETVIGPIFHDEERTQLLREAPDQLVTSELGMRAVFLGVAYREIAKARYADRQQAKVAETEEAFNGAAFTAAWELSEEHSEVIIQQNYRVDSPVRVAARQLSIINSIEASTQQQTGLRERQLDIKQGVVDGMQSPPNVTDVLKPSAPLRALSKGISVKSPTGTGKSAMEGDWVRSAGIGKPAAGPFPERLRALNIVPSVALISQVKGWRGKRTFQRLAGDEVTITAKFEGNNDTSGDVVAATTNQIRSGAVDPKEYDAVLFDETQHLLGRQLAQAYLEGALGPLVIGYTATTEYGDGRRVSQLLPYEVDGGSIIDCINEGILNNAQLFSFRVPLDTLAPKGARHELIPQIIDGRATQQAIDTAAKLAATGRRVAIYGSPGGESRHARYMAEKLNGRVVTTPSGSKKTLSAKAVGKFTTKEENDTTIQELDDHTLDVVVATDMLVEGWDADIDAVLIVRRSHSPLWVEQVIGRGTRPSEEFPVTIYMEWLPILEEDQKGLVSICDVFGENEIDQGRIFGPAFPDGKGSSQPYRRNESFEEGGPLQLEDLSPELQAFALQIDHRLVREVTTVRWQPGSVEERLPGAIPLEAIMGTDLVPDYAGPQYVAAHLQSASIPSIEQWEMNQETGRNRLVTYFAPEARTYLQEHPLPSLQQIGELPVTKISELLMISRDFIMQQVTELGLGGYKRFGHGPTVYYSPMSIMRIKREVDRLPHADEGDVMLTDLVRDLGGGHLFARRFCADPENGITPVYKRYLVEETGRYRFAYHVSRAEADRIWAEYYAMPDAEEGAMSVSEIAAEAGVALNIVRNALSEEEAAQAMWSWLPGRRAAPRKRFPRELAVELIERVRKDPLPPQLIPLSFMDKFVAADRGTFRRGLGGYEAISLRLAPGGRSTCHEWDALRYAMERYGVREGAPVIIFKNLPRSLHDKDPERIDYALSLQREHINPMIDVLEPAPTPDKAEPIPHVNVDGPRVIVRGDELDEHAIGTRLGVSIERVRQAIVETTHVKGALPPTPRLNARRELKDHFKGRRLEAIVISIAGIRPDTAALRLGVTSTGVVKFMQRRGFNPDHAGNYSLPAWEEARIAFSHVAAGFRELSEIAEMVDQEVSELWEFLQENGGRSVVRLNEQADEKRYLDPLTVRLALKQQQSHPKVPVQSDLMVNREEVARLSRQPAAGFDEWLRYHPDVIKRLVWYQVREGTKVLPHVPYSLVRVYIERAKQAAGRKGNA